MLSVKVIVVRTGIGDLSSNPERGFFCVSLDADILEKGMKL